MAQHWYREMTSILISCYVNWIVTYALGRSCPNVSIISLKQEPKKLVQHHLLTSLQPLEIELLSVQVLFKRTLKTGS